MGQGYLLDTNIVIFYLEGLLNSSDKIHVKNIIEKRPSIPVISKIEFLAWNAPHGSNTSSLTAFIKSAQVYPLDEHVVDQTIFIRKSFKKVKLPDAIELTFINPFDL